MRNPYTSHHESLLDDDLTSPGEPLVGVIGAGQVALLPATRAAEAAPAAHAFGAVGATAGAGSAAARATTGAASATWTATARGEVVVEQGLVMRGVGVSHDSLLAVIT